MFGENAIVTMQVVVLTILASLLIAIFIGSIIAFARAIWGFVTSGGDEDKIKSSWSSIRFMIVGIVLSLSVLFFFPILLEKMGINAASTYTARNVFTRAGELINRILTIPIEVGTDNSFPSSTSTDIQL